MYTTNENKEEAVSPVIGVIVTALTSKLLQLFWRLDFYDGTDGRHYGYLSGSHSCLRVRHGREHQ